MKNLLIHRILLGLLPVFSSCSTPVKEKATSCGKPHHELYFSTHRDTFGLSTINFTEGYLRAYDRKRGLFASVPIQTKAQNITGGSPYRDTLHVLAEDAPKNALAFGRDLHSTWTLHPREWVYTTDSSDHLVSVNDKLFEDFLFIEHKSARSTKSNHHLFVVGIFPKYPGLPLSKEWIQNKMKVIPLAVIDSLDYPYNLKSTLELPMVNPGHFTFHPFAENPLFTVNQQYLYAGYAHSPHLVRYSLKKQKQESIAVDSSEVQAPIFELDSVRENIYRAQYYQSANLGICLLSSDQYPKQWVRIVKKSQPHFNPNGLVNPPHLSDITVEVSNGEGTRIIQKFNLEGRTYYGINSFYSPPYLYVYNRKNSKPNLWAFDGFTLQLP